MALVPSIEECKVAAKKIAEAVKRL